MPFTKEKALALIAHANTAPLQNMQHAGGVSALLQEFAQWADEVFEKVEAKVEARIAPPSHPAPAAAGAVEGDKNPPLPVQAVPETLPVEADKPSEASPAS